MYQVPIYSRQLVNSFSTSLTLFSNLILETYHGASVWQEVMKLSWNDVLLSRSAQASDDPCLDHYSSHSIGSWLSPMKILSRELHLLQPINQSIKLIILNMFYSIFDICNHRCESIAFIINYTSNTLQLLFICFTLSQSIKQWLVCVYYNNLFYFNQTQIFYHSVCQQFSDENLQKRISFRYKTFFFLNVKN